MACYNPLRVWRSKSKNETGKRSMVFNRSAAQFADLPQEIPCGQCIGCRLERSRQWAIRCVHEASLYENNCFLTLTYNDANLPENNTLVVKDFQNFMKRLRKKYPLQKIRFFQCGEYGDTYARPHYHACIFNHDFSDKKQYSVRDGIPLYTSNILNALWPLGFCTIGEVTFDSAAYVARYIMKKVTGEKSAEHYKNRKPEYTTMSRKPGIGKGWFDKFKKDVYNHDSVIINGKQVRAPKFYDNLYDVDDPLSFEEIQKQRKYKALKHQQDNTLARLAVKEEIKLSKIVQLTRTLEEH